MRWSARRAALGVTASRHRTVVVAGRSSRRSSGCNRLWTWALQTPPIATTVLAAWESWKCLSMAGGDDAAARPARRGRGLAGSAGSDVVSEDGRGLERAVGDALAARGWRIAVAESCTGGLITSRLTDVPGSSRYVDRCVVAYSNPAKIALLQVPPALIEAHGAVSEPVALAMAASLRTVSGVDLAVATTGIARPATRRSQSAGVCRRRARRRGADVPFPRRPAAGQGDGVEYGARPRAALRAGRRPHLTARRILRLRAQ
jgi:nicotinamide-nucleotide amidase